MKLSMDLKNYNNTGAVFKRSAARGIIRHGDKFLLIHGKYGDYKFPGGGVEQGETLEQALTREIQEETGYHVISSSISCYGKVFERRRGAAQDIMEMNSHYFYCEVEDIAGQRRLDEYEEEYDYQVIWITIEDALEHNKKCVDYDACPWVIRDTKVMERLLKDKARISGYPETIRNFIGRYTLVRKFLGKSGNKVYQVGKKYYLKISADLEALRREKAVNEWLAGKLPIPEVVLYAEENNLGYLITASVPGKPASSREYLNQPEKLCKLLAGGLQMLKGIDISNCPFYAEDKEPDIDQVSFVHADYCLPNVMIRYGKVSGFVDLGGAGVGDPWLDYAWCIWSLGFNLKSTNYNQALLREIGIEFDEEKYRLFIGEGM